MILFVIYVVALIYFLFFSEEYGRVASQTDMYRYNLRPFREIARFLTYRSQLGWFAVVANLLGNVVGFVPYGFILPIIMHRFRSCLVIILSGFALSLLVECVQLVTKVGCFDVDDLILNTAGVALGYMLFVICNHFRRKHYGEKI